MRADNHGEGGILALMSLVGANNWKRGAYLGASMGLLGAALLYGDGVITPAISVLSALEGVNVATSAFKPFVVPMAVAILVALFAVQRFGTAKIGRAFGPVMLIWFIVIGLLGVVQVIAHPLVLVAISPVYGAAFLVHRGGVALLILGAVFLCATGGEALYADMGHVGRLPIRLAWYFVVLPALLLSYAGQAAALMAHGGTSSTNPFFLIAPGWAIYPLVTLATLATIIASQAIITGAFSMTRQAMQLGWLPLFSVRQTSKESYGQIYLPVVNWIMAAVTLAITLAFRSSDKLAGAYGTAVSTTMMMTTLLLYRAMVQGLAVAGRCGVEHHWRPPGRGRQLLLGQSAEAVRRRLGAADHRRDRVHGHDHLAAGRAERARPADQLTAAHRRVHRRAGAGQDRAAARRRRLPDPLRRPHAALDERLRQAYRQPAPDGDRPVVELRGDASRGPRAAGRTSRAWARTSGG